VYKPVAMLGIARSYKKLGEKNKAIAEYESVILSYPETDYARMASVAKSTL
jgi:TolA-binding protein